MMIEHPVIGADGHPLDRIVLRGIRATANHGVLASERENPQEFIADVAIYLNTQTAAEHDALAATADYAAITAAVGNVLQSQPVNLIETLAEQVAAAVLEFPQVEAVDVQLHKPNAALPLPTDDVTVTIRRDLVHRKPVQPVRFVPPTYSEYQPAPEPAPEPAEAWQPEESFAEAPAVAEEPTPVIVATVPSETDATVVFDPIAERLHQAPAEPVLAILALGSNLGNSLEILQGAVAALDDAAGINVTEVGPLARTSAVGGPAGQSDFFNTVVEVTTSLSPWNLLQAVHQIEAEFGRERGQEWGPRTLDIDIITYGDLIAATDELTIPHKLAHDRAFVLLPWSQMRPDAVLAGPGGGPVTPLAATAPDREGVRWLRLDWLAKESEPGAPAESEANGVAPLASFPNSGAYLGHSAEPDYPEDANLPEDAGSYEAAPEWADSAYPGGDQESYYEEQADFAAAGDQPGYPQQPAGVTEYPTLAEPFSASGSGDTLVGAFPASVPVPGPAPLPGAAPASFPVPSAEQHSWVPTVPTSGGEEYPTFTGILQGAPGGQFASPGARPHHAGGVPAHSTFTGEMRAESPLAARAERLPLLKPNDIEAPAFSQPVPQNPAGQVPPFGSPDVARPVTGAEPVEPETKLPSWDDILRG